MFLWKGQSQGRQLLLLSCTCGFVNEAKVCYLELEPRARKVGEDLMTDGAKTTNTLPVDLQFFIGLFHVALAKQYTFTGHLG